MAYEQEMKQFTACVDFLADNAKLKPGAVVVLGCSTSEVVGAVASSLSVASARTRPFTRITTRSHSASTWRAEKRMFMNSAVIACCNSRCCLDCGPYLTSALTIFS